MTLDNVYGPKTGMLTFLGRGAAFHPGQGNTAAYLREGDRMLLLDCGETVFARLMKTGALNGLREIYIAVSHLHSDHCGSLGSLVLYCRSVLNARTAVLIPPGEEAYAASLRSLLSIFGVPEGGCDARSEKQVPESAKAAANSWIRPGPPAFRPSAPSASSAPCTPRG